jgi:hypothetical protein
LNAHPYYIGITGHRDFTKPEIYEFVRDTLRDKLFDLKSEHNNVRALSALALGADTIFAHIALELGYELEVVVPFSRFPEDFKNEDDSQSYNSLLERAHVIHRLRFVNKSDFAYLSAGRWIVNRSHTLIAVWDGLPGQGTGGTSDIVSYAKKKGKLCWHINTDEQTVTEVKANG